MNKPTCKRLLPKADLDPEERKHIASQIEDAGPDELARIHKDLCRQARRSGNSPQSKVSAPVGVK